MTSTRFPRWVDMNSLSSIATVDSSELLWTRYSHLLEQILLLKAKSRIPNVQNYSLTRWISHLIGVRFNLSNGYSFMDVSAGKKKYFFAIKSYNLLWIPNIFFNFWIIRIEINIMWLYGGDVFTKNGSEVYLGDGDTSSMTATAFNKTFFLLKKTISIARGVMLSKWSPFTFHIFFKMLMDFASL